MADNAIDDSLTTTEQHDQQMSTQDYASEAWSSGNMTHFFPTVDGVILGKVITLCIMIIISTIGNVATVIITSRLRRRRKSTVTLLVLHLAIADLLVTYTHMLPHAIWYSVIQWYGGDFLCRVLKFFSSFGLFLSSFLTVDISLDHCMAVFYPLAKTQRPRKAKLMIIMSYVSSAIFSIPQMLKNFIEWFYGYVTQENEMALFYSERAPFETVFYQCVTIRWMDGLASSIYTTLVLFIQVCAPLFIMFAAYTAIFAKIRRESSKGLSLNSDDDNLSAQHKARSRLFMRAQQRTLRMIITIFLAFVVNWTPYVLAAMFYAWQFSNHPTSPGVRIVYETAFLFGLSNSCFNPIVYGCCNLHYFDNLCASCCAVFIGRPDSSNVEHGKTSSYTMRWSVKSSPSAKQGYGHHHPHHNNSVNRQGSNLNQGTNNQWIRGRLLAEGAVSSTSQLTVS